MGHVVLLLKCVSLALKNNTGFSTLPRWLMHIHASKQSFDALLARHRGRDWSSAGHTSFRAELSPQLLCFTLEIPLGRSFYLLLIYEIFSFIRFMGHLKARQSFVQRIALIIWIHKSIFVCVCVGGLLDMDWCSSFSKTPPWNMRRRTEGKRKSYFL